MGAVASASSSNGIPPAQKCCALQPGGRDCVQIVTYMTSTAEAPDLRYPIGQARSPHIVHRLESRAAAIETIAETPAKLRGAVTGLDGAQLDTPYRPGGWTVRQLVHHVADSHMNAYMRTRLALTEENPPVKPYDEAKWAELADAKTHADRRDRSRSSRRCTSAGCTCSARCPRTSSRARCIHPEHGALSLDALLEIYAWHGPHHTAHVTELRKREGF